MKSVERSRVTLRVRLRLCFQLKKIVKLEVHFSDKMNGFRILGDLIHLIAIIWLPMKIWKTQSCSVVSGKSQLLYLLVFICRYLDLFILFVSFYNTFMKIFFITVTAGTAFLIYKQQLHDLIMSLMTMSLFYQNIKVTYTCYSSY